MKQNGQTPLALLSAACRLPGSDTPDSFWESLLAGKDHTQVVPASRWLAEDYFGTDGRPGTTPSRWGTFVESPWEFPASQFGVRERDAAWIDPQQRLMLTCAHEALSSAGVDPREHPSIGVFVGTSYASFGERVRDLTLQNADIPGATILGVLNNMLAARVAHCLNLRGPALTIDSACSSVFVALHLARRALAAGDCDIAVVGGTHMLMSPIPHLIMGRAGALSRSGRCRPFSAAADGVVLGEGVGAFVLSRADTARVNGWPTLAYVVGTAIDNDGKTLNPMAPRPGGQLDTMRRAWEEAGLDPATASMIEAHGTGTQVGDPVEAASLAEAFPRTGSTRWLGSVKGNVGHLMSAAGVPSLLKVVWALRHRRIPPTLHDEAPREELGLREAGFELPSTTIEWEGDAPLRAGINAFGFGGTNAHLVIEEARASDEVPAAVVPVRGRTYELTVPSDATGRVGPHPLLRRRLSIRLGQATFEAHADASHPMLAEHRVGGRSILPATAICDLMLAAAAQATEKTPRALQDVRLHRPVIAGATLTIDVAIDAEARRPDVVEVRVKDDSGLLATARAFCDDAGAGEGPPDPPDASLSDVISPTDLYDALSQRGMQHGPAFRRIQQLVADRENRHITAQLGAAPAWIGVHLHPAAADAALQAIAGLLLRDPEEFDGLWLPASIERIELYRPLEGALQARVSGVRRSASTAQGQASAAATVHVTGIGWRATEVHAVFHGVQLRPVPAGREMGWFETVRWEPLDDGRGIDEGRVILDLSDFHSPLDAVRAVRDAARALTAGKALTVVTRGAFAVGEEDAPPDPTMAAAATFAAGLSAEGHACQAVDLGADDPLTVAQAAPPARPLLAWRSGRFHHRTTAKIEAPQLRDLPDGVWLLPGGGTGATASIAQALAAPGRTLLLVGRTALADAPQRLTTVRDLRARGAKVVYLQADTRTDDVRPMLEAVAEYGPLVGVVYGAGVVRTGPSLERSDSDLEDVLSTKLNGAIALARAIDEMEISPVVLLLSSISAVEPAKLGGNLADYAAANAGLDALAARQRARGHRWTSVAYSSWGEVGMAAQHMPAALLAARGLRMLEPSAAAQAALRALCGDAAHHVVAERIDPADRPKPSRPAPDDLVAFIQQFIGEALGIDRQHIAEDADFADLGLDSLDALELIGVLEEYGFGPLSDAVVFEQRTIASLAKFLESQRPSETLVAAPERAHQTDAPGPIARAMLLQTRLDPHHTPFGYLRQTVSGGPLQPERLKRAIEEVLAKTPVLRAPLVWQNGALHRGAAVARPAISLARYTVWTEDALKRLDDTLANAPLSPADPPACRWALIDGPGAGEQHLCMAAHHGVLDGFSMHRVAQRVWVSYAGEPIESAPIIAEPERSFDPAGLQAWAEHVRRPWPKLPGLTGAPPSGARDAVVRRLQVPVGLARGGDGAHRFPVIAAAFVRALGAWAELDDVVLQVAAGRRELLVGRRDAIGCFADTVPLVVAVTAASPEQVRRAWDDAVAHGAPGLVDLAPYLPEAPDRGPRVASPFGLSVATFRGEAALGHTVDDVVARTASGATRVGLTVWMLDDQLGFSVNYPPSWVDRQAVVELADHLARELSSEGATRTFDAAPAKSDPSMTAVTEIVEDAEESAYKPFFADIVGVFEVTPDATAAVDRNTAATYAEIVRDSGYLAAVLVGRGVGKGDIVGAMHSGGISALVALLGVMRSGAAWLPLDPEQAPERQRAMLEIAKPTLTLVEPGAGGKSVSMVPPDQRISIESAIAEGRDSRVALPTIEADDVAYVLFTSGSQGLPKGVPIHHAALSHYLRWSVQTLGLGPGDRLLQTSALGFDAVLRQLLAPLMAGATVHMTAVSEVRDPVALWRRAAAERVSMVNTSPAAAARLVEAARKSSDPVPPLRLLTVGGERLAASLVQAWRALAGADLRVLNLYGPTETTINATWHEVEANPVEPVSIGRPLPGYDVVVLDPDGRASREGELCVGGIGRFRGYLGDVPAPLVEFEGNTFYRTGDRVRRQSDGTLLFLGRLDAQVQVRGVRVEPGEVEVALRRLPSVRAAAVLPQADGESMELIAWVEADRAGWDEKAARDELRNWLPDAFLPRRITRLDELPLGPTGKVDRRKLQEEMPASTEVEPSSAHEAPLSGTERRVAAAWAAVLDRDVGGVGRRDDFFALGGDSMAAIEVCAALLAPGTALLYANPTLEGFSDALDAATDIDPTQARSTGRTGLLPAQVGFLRAARLNPGREAVWRGEVALQGELDVPALQRAWAFLHARHSMLRASFPEGRIRIRTDEPPQLDVLEVPDLSEVESFEPRLSVADDWLVRGRLVRSSAGDRIDVAGHHLIGDGWSVAVLMNELCAAHDAFAAGRTPELPPLPDLDEVIHHATNPPTAAGARDYWRQLFANPISPPFNPHQGAVEHTLHVARHAPRATPSQVLAAVYRALRDVTGQDDLVLGVAQSGRDLPVEGIAHVVAPLATGLPVRISPRPNEEVKDAVERALRAAMAHAVAPGELARSLQPAPPPDVSVFVTDVRFAIDAPARKLRVDPERSRTEMQLPPGISLQVSVHPGTAQHPVRLRFSAAQGPLADPHALEDFADATVAALVAGPGGVVASRKEENMSGSRGIAPGGGLGAEPPERVVNRRRAALVTYLPERRGLREMLGADPAKWLPSEPRTIGTIDAGPLGCCTVWCLPQFADELTVDLDALAALVERAGRDADVVSLAGLLPAHTGYGESLKPRLSPEGQARLTTGHATTVVSVTRTTLEALRAVGRTWSQSRVAVLGVGSIGRAAISALVRREGPPAELVLCDIAARRAVVERVAAKLACPVIVVDGGRTAPHEVYAADVILGATSTPRVLDPMRLHAGTVVIDDSFPPCFDMRVAQDRMRTKRDVLLLGGGLMTLPELTIRPDDDLAALASQVRSLLPTHGLPGCAADALLAPPALGLVSDEAVDRAWNAAEAANARPAPLHRVGGAPVATELIDAMRSLKR